MDRLFLDFETYSRVDLFKCGGDRYSRDPSTRPLMLAYALNDEPVDQWVPEEGEPLPRRLREMLDDREVIKSAWNAPFEIRVFKNCLREEIRISEWRCSMAMAATLSLPLSLDKCGKVLKMPEGLLKSTRGKALIRMFSQPNKPTKRRPYTNYSWLVHSQEWEEFKEYNVQDIEAERGIFKRIKKWDLPAHEWALWADDQRINERGIPINLAAVDKAIQLAERFREDAYAEMRQITGLANPRSRDQLLEWLSGAGYSFEDLKAGHVKKAAREAEPGSALHRVLTLRAAVSKTSVDKFYALERATADDGNLRGAFQFAGAGRTWRWSGRIYQPQNLPRPPRAFEDPEKTCQAVRDLEDLPVRELETKYPEVMDLLTACVRPVVQAPEGMLLIGADLNAIENRVLGWLADCPKILDVFRQGRCPYVDFATYMFHQPYSTLYAEYKAGDKSKRTTAKPGVLGCGYMLGAGRSFENEKTGEIEGTGLLGYAWNMGMESFTQDQAKHSVDVWRSTFTEVVEFWYAIERAAKRCVKTGQATECGYVRFDTSGPFLRMILPSGRALHYVRPRLENKLMPWGKVKEVLTYEGLNDQNQWVRIQTHPGKLTENADQAISRDLLAHGIQLAEDEGIKVRLHVHDEIVAAVRERRAQEDLQILIECMRERPRWGKGLPLNAEGSVSKYFLKD